MRYNYMIDAPMINIDGSHQDEIYMILEIGTMHGFSDMPTLPVPARHCTEVYVENRFSGQLRR